MLRNDASFFTLQKAKNFKQMKNRGISSKHADGKIICGLILVIMDENTRRNQRESRKIQRQCGFRALTAFFRNATIKPEIPCLVCKNTGKNRLFLL